MQFTVEKSDFKWFKKWRLAEIVFVVKLQTSHELSHRKNNFGEFN